MSCRARFHNDDLEIRISRGVMTVRDRHSSVVTTKSIASLHKDRRHIVVTLLDGTEERHKVHLTPRHPREVVEETVVREGNVETRQRVVGGGYYLD
jgi:hypothetical protein